ncbi:MAG: glycosyltransferase 87 family protein, partial [Bacteroidia bacterium]
MFADYGSIYASTEAWVSHRSPYADYALVYRGTIEQRNISVSSINLNPPISLFLFRPFVSLEPFPSLMVWRAVSLCLFGAALAIVLNSNPNPRLQERMWLVLGMTGIWQTFELNQNYMILF